MSTTRGAKRSTQRVDNPDIIPFALYELGGAGQFIDVEDVFLRCYQIAPERFGWRRHPYPNYKTLSKALRDFEGKNPSLLLKTTDGLCRQLSAEAVSWVEKRLDLFETVRDPGAHPPTRRTGQRILNELRDHALTQAFLNGEPVALKRHDVSDLLLCSPDSPPAVWRERIESFRSAARQAQRVDLLRFLDFLMSEEPEWFRG